MRSSAGGPAQQIDRADDAAALIGQERPLMSEVGIPLPPPGVTALPGHARRGERDEREREAEHERRTRAHRRGPLP